MAAIKKRTRDIKTHKTLEPSVVKREKTSIISPEARIDPTVVIGPYSIIEDDVEIDAQTKIGSHVIIKNGARIGKNNFIYAGTQISTDPQDHHFKGEFSQCIIGDNNIIREYTTISRATGENEKTMIGNNNMIMTYVHIAHNNRIGDNTVVSSNTQLGGYVELDDYVNIGGLTGVHQYCRIGKYAMLGAKSYLNKDLAPYLLARGNRAKVHGLNVKGLTRNSFSWQQIEEIKNIYRMINESRYTIAQCLEVIETNKNNHVQAIAQFIKDSKRGILLHR